MKTTYIVPGAAGSRKSDSAYTHAVVAERDLEADLAKALASAQKLVGHWSAAEVEAVVAKAHADYAEGQANPVFVLRFSKSAAAASAAVAGYQARNYLNVRVLPVVAQ